MNGARFSRSARRAVLVTIVTAVLASTVGYLAMNPPRAEQFFQMYLLGRDGTASGYYPNDHANLTVDASMSWQLGVQNLIGDTQYLLVNVLLGNRSSRAPNSTTCTPADLPPLHRYRQVLTANATYEEAITWSITNITTNGRAYTLQLLFDGTTYNSSVEAVDGLGFRIIFELWTVNPETQDLQFGWTSGTERRCAWLQIWFNATRV